MTKEDKPASESKAASADGTETGATAEKKSSLFNKLAARKSYILHSLFVFILFAFFAWQVLDFYQLSTDYNRARAVKTRHMVIYDIQEGKYLANLPASSTAKSSDSGTQKARPAEDEAATSTLPVEPQVAVILLGLGKNAAYTSDVTSLPPEFIFSYSPYASKPLETSKYKTSEGATVIAEVLYSDGKFDISPKNTDFRNNNNAAAAISKIFGASAVYIAAPENYISSKAFTALAEKLEQTQITIIVPPSSKASGSNVVISDVLVKAVTSPTEIKLALSQLEKAAKEDGYAIAVIEAQPGVGAALREWAAGLEAKNIKLTPVIKN
jgi:polysaccharide deacetylase 2 family uncharacterized protein YibQ